MRQLGSAGIPAVPYPSDSLRKSQTTCVGSASFSALRAVVENCAAEVTDKLRLVEHERSSTFVRRHAAKNHQLFVGSHPVFSSPLQHSRSGHRRPKPLSSSGGRAGGPTSRVFKWVVRLASPAFKPYRRFEPPWPSPRPTRQAQSPETAVRRAVCSSAPNRSGWSLSVREGRIGRQRGAPANRPSASRRFLRAEKTQAIARRFVPAESQPAL